MRQYAARIRWTTRLTEGETHRGELQTGEGGSAGYRLMMRGPQDSNLKVWAERDYRIEKGLSAGEKRDRNIISAEGTGLQSDEKIVVYTEWLAPDGSALPEGLAAVGGAQYGLTGRLAKVVSEDTLQAAGFHSEQAEFPIGPGRQTQILQLNDGLSHPEHYYIHVIGKAKNQEACTGGSCADFDYLGSDVGVAAPLDTRPRYVTPILTPHYDEQSHWLAYREYRRLLNAGEDPANGDPATGITPTRPLPTHAWNHRPEYQFSRYSLEMDEINRINQDPVTGTETKDNIYHTDTPVIGSSDDLIEVLYSLIGPEFDRLTPIDGGQDLILAIGEEETRLTLGEDNTLRFDNIDHLAGLDPEDFLTMRLYLNQDAGNVLWEYAFSHLSLFPERNSALENEYNIIEITADDAFEGLQSVNAYLNTGKPSFETLRWGIVGQGSVSPPVSTSINGVFSASLALPTQADDLATVYASYGDESNRFYSTTYRVIPGVASTIIVEEQTGKTVVGGLGEVQWTLSIKDAFGNDVQDGTDVSVMAPELRMTGSTVVNNGKITLKFTGQSQAGNNDVTLKVGNAELTQAVSVHDVSLSFMNLDDVPVNSTTPITIQATSSYGNLSGLELDVAAHRGNISSSRVALNDSGQATLSYYAGQYRGFAQISTKISGTHTLVTDSFSVTESGSFLESNVLVTNGSGTIDLGDGVNLNYSGSTDLNIATLPNENVRSSLVNIFEPPVYALQDFSTDLGQAGNGVVLDVSSGIDAASNNVSLVGAGLKDFNLSWNLNKVGSEQTYIDVPEHARTSTLSEAGLNFWIKIPDMSHLAAGTTLADWDDYGLKLQLNTDQTLSLVAQQSNTTQTLTNATVIRPNQWYQVAAHYYQGKLRLGVDGQVEKTVATGPLVPSDSQSYALRVNLDTQQLDSFQITGLKIYDWHGEAKVTYTDGSFEQNVVADAQGKASVTINARPPLLAYTRHYEEKTLVAQLGHFFISSAYAQGNDTACQNTYQPIDPGEDDATIRSADQYMAMLLECFVKPHVEQARVSYETSEGFFEKTVALVKRETMETAYAVLKQQKKNSIVILNCIDAVVTGSNSSAAGAGCDFVTSMLAIGDLRDILLQAWHYNLGHLTGTEDDYDELTAQLSAIGLVASGSQLLPAVGQTGGVVATAFVATAKTVSKILHKVGAAGKSAGRFIARKLGKIMDNPATTTGQKLTEVKGFIPLMEIGSSLALVYQEEPRLFSFFVHTIRSGKALDNTIAWFDRYLAKLETELIALNEARFPAWLDYFISPAHADITNIAKGKFVAQLTKLLDSVDLLPDMPTADAYKALAPMFGDQLDRFLKLVDEPDYKFGMVPNDMDVLRAFITVSEMGGKSGRDTVAKFARHSGYVLGIPFDGLQFIKTFSEMDLTSLPADVQNALGGLIRTFENPKMGFSVTKGNIAHVLTVADMLKGREYKVLAVEKLADKLVTASGAAHAGRRVDIRAEVDVGGVKIIIDIEVKNWLSTTWKDNLTAAMSKTPKGASGVATTAAKEVGQLYTDLLRYMMNGNKGQQWVFTPDIIETGLNKADMEVKIVEHIKDLIVKNQDGLALEFDNLNLKVQADRVRWEKDVLPGLFDALDGEGVDGQRFVKIFGYDNIVQMSN